MKKFISEFKEFAVKGNVLDMAVGVVIGSAFGKIVTSFVEDIITPAIGLLLGKVNFSGLAVKIGDASIGYGKFIQAIIDFLIVAFAIFMAVKGINKLKRKEEAVEEAEEEAAVAEDIALLTEIRDLLKKQ